MLVQRTSTVFFLILSCLCAVYLAQLSWQVIGIFVPSTTHINSQESTRTPHQESTDFTSNPSITAIKQLNLFGLYRSSPTPTVQEAPKNLDDIQKTNLKINLLGLIQGEHSAAVLIYNGEQSAYREGDFLKTPSNQKIQIASIEQRFITIYNNGVLERLDLPELNRSAPIKSDTSSTDQQLKSIDLSSPEIRTMIGGDAQSLIRQNPLALTQFFNLTPSRKAGKLFGYRVRPGQDTRLMALSGLKNGDLVTHINDQPVSTLKLNDLFQTLSSADQISLTIKRGDQLMNMDIKL